MLATVTREEATGEVLEMFEAFEEMTGGFFPRMFEFNAIRPSVLKGILNRVREVYGRGALSPVLLSSLRLHVALNEQYPLCMEFNTGILKRLGWSDGQVNAVRNFSGELPLSSKERLLAEKVSKAIYDGPAFSRDDVDELIAAGWEEIDVFDAVEHAANVLKMGRMFTAFNVRNQ